jgi:hypothetical protein
MEVVDPKRRGDELVLQIDNVAIAVFGEVCLQSIARLARLAVANVVREDQVVAARIQWPARIEQRAHIGWATERQTIGSRPVQEENCIVDVSSGVAMRFAERRIVDTQTSEGLFVAEFVILEPGVGLLANGVRLSSPGGIVGAGIGLRTLRAMSPALPQVGRMKPRSAARRKMRSYRV